MPQSDIDKILADIKKRKEQSQASQPVTQQTAVAVADRQPETETAPVKNNRISEKDKEKLSQFINSSPAPKTSETLRPAEEIELDTQFATTDYVSKKSEDYIDENFMNFFTQSVIVTKSPEETQQLQVKRKKGGFFKRKYITDSLSLNNSGRRGRKEKDKEITPQRGNHHRYATGENSG